MRKLISNDPNLEMIAGSEFEAATLEALAFQRTMRIGASPNAPKNIHLLELGPFAFFKWRL